MKMKFTKGNKTRNLRMAKNTILLYLWTWLVGFLLKTDLVTGSFLLAIEEKKFADFLSVQFILIGGCAIWSILVHINAKRWMKPTLEGAYYAFFGWIPQIKRKHPEYLTTIKGMKWKKKQLEKQLANMDECCSKREAIEKDIDHLSHILEFNKYWKEQQEQAIRVAYEDPTYQKALKKYERRRDSVIILAKRQRDERKGIYLDDSYYHGDRPSPDPAPQYVRPPRNLFLGGFPLGIIYLIAAFFIPIATPLFVFILMILSVIFGEIVKNGTLYFSIVLIIPVILAYFIHPDITIKETEPTKRVEVSDLDISKLFYIKS